MTCYSLFCPVPGVSVSAPLLAGGGFLQLTNKPDVKTLANSALRHDWQTLAAKILVLNKTTGEYVCGVGFETADSTSATTDSNGEPVAAPAPAVVIEPTPIVPVVPAPAPEAPTLPGDSVTTIIEGEELVPAPVVEPAPIVEPAPEAHAPVAKEPAPVVPAKGGKTSK